METYEDVNAHDNCSEYYTGKDCIEPGCDKPAGTYWSPHWCFECNVIRIKRISEQLDLFQRRFKEKKL